MSELYHQPSPTPSRRSQGRVHARAAAHKAYASENDVASIDPSRYDHPPRTPRKPLNIDSPASNAQSTQSKQRSRNKPRSKNSPESARSGRYTPPQQPKPTTTPAFAGATFHASPAPSALPIPSFLAKPPSDSPNVKEADDIPQEPSPPTDNKAPTPSHQATKATEESPLDFMFRAHREEKERQRRDSSASFQPSNLSHESPSSRSPVELGGRPKPATLPQAARSQPRFQAGGIASAELDGTPGRPMGPAFSTPYHERIKAARSTSGRPPTLPKSASAPEDPSEALKAFLFGGYSTSPRRPEPAGYPSVQSAQASPSRPPVTANGSTNGNVNGRDGHRAHTMPSDIQAMEDNLRRILKLDLAAGPDRHILS